MPNNLKNRKTWLPIHKENWFGDWFDPHESYLRLPSFWWPFTVIMIGVALVSWKVIHDQELVLGLDSRVEQWYEWFKIPLWVLALLIPVLGLFNANHKSEQTKASMGLTQKSIDAAGAQNRFANYYKHVEEFCKYVESSNYTNVVDLKKIDSRKLHRLLFPTASEGFYQAAVPVKIDFWGIVESFAESCVSLLKDELDEVEIRRAANLHRSLIKIMLKQGNIFQSSLKDTITEGSNRMIKVSKPSVSTCMRTVLNEIEFVHWLLSFDTSFDRELLLDGVRQQLDQVVLNMAVNDVSDVISRMSVKSIPETLENLENFLLKIKFHSVWLESQSSPSNIM